MLFGPQEPPLVIEGRRAQVFPGLPVPTVQESARQVLTVQALGDKDDRGAGGVHDAAARGAPVVLDLGVLADAHPRENLPIGR